MKKPPSKVAHNRPPTFFLCTGPAAQTAQKQKSRTTKRPLMQDWIFRLGLERCLLADVVKTLDNSQENRGILFHTHAHLKTTAILQELIRKQNRPQTKKRIQNLAARLKEKRKLCLLTQVFLLIMYY